MSEDGSIVLYEKVGGLARITMNRPAKRNALNQELVSALKVALNRANSEEDVRVVVLTGAGEDFCSGADLESLRSISGASVDANLADARSLMELFVLIREVRVPVIAAVRGRALAGGCGLALGCDMVLAARSARFGFPEVKIGFVPALVTSILRRSVSEKRAFELLTLGGEISAEEADTFGLVNRVLDDEAFEDELEAFVAQFDRVSRSAVSLTKQLFYKTDGMSFDDALESGVDTNVTARMSKDCQAGIAKFLKKAGPRNEK